MLTPKDNPIPFLRRFKDARGVTWDVWEVRPELHPSPPPAHAGPLPETTHEHVRFERRVAAHPLLRDGWLTFQAGDERRRLSPIPERWRSATDRELEELCVSALPVGR